MCPFKMIWYKQMAEFEYSVFFMIQKLRQFALRMEEEKNEVYYTLQSGRLFP